MYQFRTFSIDTRIRMARMDNVISTRIKDFAYFGKGAFNMAYFDDTNTQQSNLKYIRKSMKERLLSKEEEQDLAIRWTEHKDEKALHQLINAYGRLVVAMAHKFKHYGLPLSDLIQEGNIGLLEAANRFEPDRDLRFSTYATWWVRSTMQDYVLRNWSIVRTGTTAAQKSLFFNMKRIQAKIAAANENDMMTDDVREEIAHTMGVRLQDVKEMEGRLSGADQSLNHVMGDDSTSEIQDFLADDRSNPEEALEILKDGHTRSKWLAKALGTLSDREQTIIKKRSLSNKVVTLEALGEELGVSKERVRQIENAAHIKMKRSLLQSVGNDTSLLY